MRYTEIAIAKPFEGKPAIHLPAIFGASAGKPILLRIPVTGQRPMRYEARNLPQGLALQDNILSGSVAEEGNYTVTVVCENELGRDEVSLTLEIGGGVLLTPLLGFTSWNAYCNAVTQTDLETAAKRMVDSGIAEYGYSYVNLDSGWQWQYGGALDAIQPNPKFPDMKAMCDRIHGYGLKCGIYSTPMLTAWGCPDEYASIPGCTQGSPDPLFSDRNEGIGTVRKEANNVRQWVQWGFDYLKYDWSPCDPYNAECMRRELEASPRDFGFCVTIKAVPGYLNYWSTHCNSYRDNTDSKGSWDNLMKIYNSYAPYTNAMRKGHFFDLDMLDTGTCNLLERRFADRQRFTEDEELLAFSLRAFMGSPIQISSTMENLTEFELSMYCNDEILAINQDTAFCSAKPHLMLENGSQRLHVYRRRLQDGALAFAAFNLGSSEQKFSLYFDEQRAVRDVWAKKDLAATDQLLLTMPPHTVRIFKTTAAE